MAKLNNLILSTSFDINSKQIICEDATVYPITIDAVDYDRDELAILLVWSNSKTSSFTTVGADLSNNLPINSLYVSATNNTYYWFRVVAVPLWSALITYNEGDIVNNNGLFYTLGDTTSLAEEPGTQSGQDWSLLTTPLSTTNITAIDTYIATIDHGYNDSFVNVDYNNFKIDNYGEHLYKITDQMDDGLNKSIIIKDFKGTVLDGFAITSAQEIYNIDLSAYGDGVYFIQAFDSSLINIYSDIIYDFTDLKSCYISLFDDIMCSGDYGVGCDCTINTNCDSGCGSQADIDIKRHNLNLLTGFYYDIVSRINMERSLYMNQHTISDLQRDRINDIGFAIANAKMVTQRCGICSTSSSLCDNGSSGNFNQTVCTPATNWDYFYRRS